MQLGLAHKDTIMISGAGLILSYPQWNLRVIDVLGPITLSFIAREVVFCSVAKM